jgi:2'-5' RNA ligase
VLRPFSRGKNQARVFLVLNNAHAYSIWLKPTGEVRAELAGIISRLSREYSTPLFEPHPVFEPHVTLIGALTGQEENLIAQTRQLAGQLRPFVVQLGDLGCLDEFYRCLFIHVQETEPVMKANAQARKVFHRESDDKYMPHLSLLYGNLPPAVKEEIMTQIGRSFHRSFPVDRIHLMSTQGDTEDWYLLGEFALDVLALDSAR